MKSQVLYRPFASVALALVLGSVPLHAQNLINNGTLESWGTLSGNPPTGIPTSWATTGTSPTQAPGLVAGSTYSALLAAGGSAQIYQTFAQADRPPAFQLDFVFASLDPGSSSARSLNLQLNIPPAGGGILAAVNMRLVQGSVAGKLTLQIFGGAWTTVAADAFDASVYNLATNTFTTLNSYNFRVTGSFVDNTYSISYGAVGGPTTNLGSFNYFQNTPSPANGQTLAGVNFASNQSAASYAIDNVSVVAVPEVSTFGLIIGGAMFVMFFVRRRRSQTVSAS